MKGSRKNSDNDNDVYDESTRDISDEDEECDDDENTTRKIKSNTGQNKTKKTYKKTKTTKRGSLNKNGRNSNKGTRTMTVSDRHREFQDITNGELWCARIVYGAMGECITSVSADVNTDFPNKGDITLSFKMCDTDDADKLNGDLDITILYGGSILASINFPQAHTNYVETEDSDGRSVWITETSTRHIYAKITLVKNEPWSGIDLIEFNINTDDLITTCMKLGTFIIKPKTVL